MPDIKSQLLLIVSFTLTGTGQVIKGLDRGIEGMFIGGSREIIVPSELG